MRAVRIAGGGVVVEDVAESVPEGWATVTVAAAGICSSDLHLVHLGACECTLGHEVAGWDESGRAVAVLPLAACGRCPQCQHGRPQLCPSQVGFHGVSLDGGMAERVAVRADLVRPLPDGLDPRDACWVEPLAVAVHGVHRAGVSPGQRVLVIGAGPIGLSAVVAAVAAGAQVEVAEVRPDRSERARALGADAMSDERYDVVVDAVGSEGSFELACRRCRSGGTVALLGTQWDPVPLSHKLQSREISLVPAFMYGRHHGSDEFDMASDLLA